ncbi:MAG: hypothetical protein L6V95_08550 [Candidatus Melainabacteria bacterium]|nr:MAG: hypothetical protein L6V95_08550 [Candidatus Melainabacteria bacterium]
MKITSNLQSFNGLNLNGLKRVNNINNSHMSMPLSVINKDMVSFGGIKRYLLQILIKQMPKKQH